MSLVNYNYQNIEREDTLPFVRNVEDCPVTASRIICRNMRWIKRKRIYDICINRPIKSMHLPIRRHCSIRKKKIYIRSHSGGTCKDQSTIIEQKNQWRTYISQNTLQLAHKTNFCYIPKKKKISEIKNVKDVLIFQIFQKYNFSILGLYFL